MKSSPGYSTPWGGHRRRGRPLVHSQGNILAHEYLKRGNADEAIARSAHVVKQIYYTPLYGACVPGAGVRHRHRRTGRKEEALIYSSDQGTYDTAHECSLIVGWPIEKVHVINKLVGGGFGGKEDVSVQHHAAAVSLLYRDVR